MIISDEDDNWNKTDPVALYGPNSKQYVEIYGLDDEKKYEIATKAFNKQGQSEMSDIETVKPGQEENITRK